MTLLVNCYQRIMQHNIIVFVVITCAGNDYFSKLKDELSSLCMWAELQNQTVILMGALNLNRMDTNKREGKLLIDLEESFNLSCLINSPTWIILMFRPH